MFIRRFVPLAMVSIALLLAGCASSGQSESGSDALDAAAACGRISDAIGVVRDAHYSSASAINAENDVTQVIKDAAASIDQQITIDKGQPDIQMAKIKRLASELATAWTFSDELAQNQPGFDSLSSLKRGNGALIEIVDYCTEIGAEMTNTAFNFQVPVESKPQQPTQAQGTDQAGYKDNGNGVRYQFVDLPCDYARCVHLELVAYSTCPTAVYVLGSQTDGNGVSYGITNDLIGPMRAGETAIATLRATESLATKINIVRVDCY